MNTTTEERVSVWINGQVYKITLRKFDRMLHDGEIMYNNSLEGWEVPDETDKETVVTILVVAALGLLCVLIHSIILAIH